MKEWEKDFEQELIEDLSAIAPEENEIRAVNPWSRAMNQLIWGLILTTVTLNFFGLQYILPPIGAFLTYIGIRSLRKENRFFRWALLLSVAQLISCPLWTGILATPFAEGLGLTWGIVSLICRCAMFYCLRRALREVFAKSGLSQPKDPFLWALVWTVVTAAAALSPLSDSWIVFLILVMGYGCVIHSLWQVGNILGDAGYRVVNAPVKISAGWAALLYSLCCLAVVFSCGFFASRQELKPMPYAAAESSPVRQELLNSGFPKEILQELSDEDAALLSGAIHIDTVSELLMFDPVETISGARIYNEPGKKNLSAVTVSAELPGNQIYILHFFSWEGAFPPQNDGFTIWGEEGIQLISGKLIFEQDGQRFSAPIPRLSCQESAKSSAFLGSYRQVTVTGGVQYPFGADSPRGYLLYRLDLPAEQWLGCTCFNYLHSSLPFFLPYGLPEEKILSGGESYRQHYSCFYLKDYREENRCGNCNQ